jgi:hypothetical protein
VAVGIHPPAVQIDRSGLAGIADLDQGVGRLPPGQHALRATGGVHDDLWKDDVSSREVGRCGIGQDCLRARARSPAEQRYGNEQAQHHPSPGAPLGIQRNHLVTPFPA